MNTILYYFGIFLITSVGASEDCTTAYSYCDLTIASHSWIRGSGIPIRSWIKSVVPNYNNCSGNTRLLSNAEGDFQEISGESTTWRKYGSNPHDGYFYEDGKIKAYIYDDMTTVLVGEFTQDGFLLEGRASKIVAYKCHKGILKLSLSKKLSSEVYSYDPINEFAMHKGAVLMDPLERRQLFVNSSLLPGLHLNEGLFAKKFIPGDFKILFRFTVIVIVSFS